MRYLLKLLLISNIIAISYTIYVNDTSDKLMQCAKTNIEQTTEVSRCAETLTNFKNQIADNFICNIVPGLEQCPCTQLGLTFDGFYND